MSDPSNFHPDVRRVARLLPRSELTTRSLRRSRRLESLTLGLASRLARGVEIVEITNNVTGRLFRPTSGTRDRRAVLWIHGGGYVSGRAAMDDRICWQYAERLGAVVIAVEYRRAPEHPFPTPLEDCYAALVWLASRPDVDESRIVIAGASAGGGLAAALALLARDRAEVAAAAQILCYPMLDDRTAARRDIDRVHRLWGNASNRFAWRCYTGRTPGDTEMPAYAVPSRAESLAGLPPAWIGVGTADLFHDEDLAYARRLAEAGVACELEVVPGGYHGFDILQSKKPVAKAFLDSQLRAADEYLNS